MLDCGVQEFADESAASATSADCRKHENTRNFYIASSLAVNVELGHMDAVMSSNSVLPSQCNAGSIVLYHRLWGLQFFLTATGICKKKYPFKNWVSECANPLPVSSKLKVYSRVACRSSEIKYPFCKSVFGQNTFSTLTKWGEGWVRQKHKYRKATFFANTGSSQLERAVEM